MPVVTRADCTEISAVEYWKFDWKSSPAEFEAYLDRAEIDFNSCQGAGRNNDLEAFYQRLYNEGRASWDDREKLRRTVVGEQHCHSATDGLMFDAHDNEQYYKSPELTSESGQLYSIKVFGGTNEGNDYLHTSVNGDVSLVSSADDDKAKWRLIPRDNNGSIFNLRPSPESNDLPNNFSYLSGSYFGSVAMNAGDAGKGNELWYLHKYPGTDNVYNIFIGGNTRLEDRYLSTSSAGNPDLYHKDDASGRQRWVIELLDDTFDTGLIEYGNVAVGKPTSQSSTSSGGVSSRAVDGDIDGIFSNGSVTHTEGGSDNWWEVNLLDTYDISSVIIYNRSDCCSNRLEGFTVSIYNNDVGVFTYTHPEGTPPYENVIPIPSGGVEGDRLKVTNDNGQPLSLAEVVVEAPLIQTQKVIENVSIGKPTSQSGTNYGGDSSRAVDGDINGEWANDSVTHTTGGSSNWWEVDLMETYDIKNIIVYNRSDCCSNRLQGFTVSIFNNGVETIVYTHPGGTPPYENVVPIPGDGVNGDKVKVSITNGSSLSLAEVVVEAEVDVL